MLPFTPENLAGLSSKLYSWLPFLDTAVPVSRGFLGMDLALEPMRAGSILGYILVGLSGFSMFVQQKMSQVASADPTQQSTQRMMLFHVPRHVRDVQPLLPPRTSRLLGGFHPDRYRDAVFRHRLGRTLPADPIGPERRHSETRAYLERSPAG